MRFFEHHNAAPVDILQRLRKRRKPRTSPIPSDPTQAKLLERLPKRRAQLTRLSPRQCDARWDVVVPAPSRHNARSEVHLTFGSEFGELDSMSLSFFEALTRNRMLKSSRVRYAKRLDGRGLSFM